MQIRTVELQLMRTGTAHNRLLSPDTDYIALCGDRDPDVVHVPFEHYQFLRRLRTLRYHADERNLTSEVAEIRTALIDMLLGIRSLTEELTAASDADLIELRLVLSSAELSLLPFELIAEPGLPPRPLAQTPIVIVRRTRRVPAQVLEWPHRPRVLFAFAAPQDTGGVPAERNLLALREALAPWLIHADAESGVDECQKYVHVLPWASVDAIESACARHEFSHVHILAHGRETNSQLGGDKRYGLALHDERRPRQSRLVDGRQLASALAGGDKNTSVRLPTLVTLASCDSGNQASVLMPGGSVAHDLHDAGVAMVVASQFPLSFTGSSRMLSGLYSHLLWGEDPRAAFHATRCSLHAHAPEGIGSLDWASVVAYGAFPPNFDRALEQVRINQVRRAADAAVAMLDDRIFPRPRSKHPTVAKRALGHAMDRLYATPHPRKGWYMASVWKRWAEALDYYYGKSELGEPLPEVVGVLRKARDDYMAAYRDSCSPSALVQHLAVCAFIGQPHDGDLIIAANRLVRLRLEEGLSNGELHIEMLRASVEAGLLAWLWQRSEASAQVSSGHGASNAGGRTVPSARREGLFHPERQLHLLLGRSNPESYELYSLRRQLARYMRWCSDIEDEVKFLERRLSEFGAHGSWSAIVDWAQTEHGYEVTLAASSTERE